MAPSIHSGEQTKANQAIENIMNNIFSVHSNVYFLLPQRIITNIALRNPCIMKDLHMDARVQAIFNCHTRAHYPFSPSIQMVKLWPTIQRHKVGVANVLWVFKSLYEQNLLETRQKKTPGWTETEKHLFDFNRFSIDSLLYALML